MTSQYTIDRIRANVKFILNDLTSYNLFIGEVVGQISDGKWENSRQPMEYFWVPDAVYDKHAEKTGWAVNTKSYLKNYYTGNIPNPLANDLLSCECCGDYFYIRRGTAFICAALAGIKVTYDNSSPIEYMWNRVAEGKSMDTVLEEMEAEDAKNSKYGSYKGFIRLGLTKGEFEHLYHTMHYYFAETLQGDDFYGPRSKARKNVVAALKVLKEEMHKVFDVE